MVITQSAERGEHQKYMLCSAQYEEPKINKTVVVSLVDRQYDLRRNNFGCCVDVGNTVQGVSCSSRVVEYGLLWGTMLLVFGQR